MKYLQLCFKPYYKWITFNTLSILAYLLTILFCFKPYYKWITFNTWLDGEYLYLDASGFKPYYKWITFNTLEAIKRTTQQTRF